MAANYCAGVGLITKCFHSTPIKSYISRVLLVLWVVVAQERQDRLVSCLKAQSTFYPLATACGITLTRTNTRHVHCGKLVMADTSLFCQMTKKIYYHQNFFIFKGRNVKQVRGGLSIRTFLSSTTLSWNIGNQSPNEAGSHPRRTDTLATRLRKVTHKLRHTTPGSFLPNNCRLFFSLLFIPSVWFRPLVHVWKVQCNYLKQRHDEKYSSEYPQYHKLLS